MNLLDTPPPLLYIQLHSQPLIQSSIQNLSIFSISLKYFQYHITAVYLITSRTEYLTFKNLNSNYSIPLKIEKLKTPLK